MSESYKLPSRKQRSQPEDPQHRKNMLSHDKPGRWSHDKHDQDDPQDDPHNGSAAQPDLRRQPGRVEQALHDTGLDSSEDDGEEEEGQEAWRKRKKKRTGTHQGGAKERSGQGRGGVQQGQGQSGDNPFGALVRAANQDERKSRQGPAITLPASICLSQCKFGTITHSLHTCCLLHKAFCQPSLLYILSTACFQHWMSRQKFASSQHWHVVQQSIEETW